MTHGATPSSAATRHALAAAWAVATFSAAAASAPAQGIGRDESVYLVAAESYAAFWSALPHAPAPPAALADRYFAVNHEHPGLAKELYGATHALLTERLGWTGHLQGFRTGAFLVAALLSWLLALAGAELAGVAGALLAPALFWAVPRHVYHAHPAALDMPATALWLATVLCWRRCTRAASPAAARRWALATGLVFGAAVSVKHNGWFLPPLLAAQAACAGALRWWGRSQLRSAGAALAAMAVLGPLVLVGSWPWLWHETLPRIREYLAFHLHHENYSWLYLGQILREPPFPIAYPFVVTALTVPTAVLGVLVGGLLHACGRIAAGWRGRAASVEAGDDLVLVVNAIFPIALIAWPTVPIFGGVKHWLPAMPFLALLGARALAATGRALWPRRQALAIGGLAVAALLPGALAVAHVHPFGTAAYNELAGGAPGAAALGMQRQYWGDAPVALLEALDRHARPGARVWWQETTGLAVRAWQRDRRLRADLRVVDGPESADISLWQFHQEFRDKEYRTWTAFAPTLRLDRPEDLPRPVAGVYLDEVPLVTVYARPGAWR